MKSIIARLLEKPTGMKKEEIIKLLEIPPNQEMGDYAFPCFSLAGSFRKNPLEIAKEIKDSIKLPKEIEKIQVSGPYINFFVNKKILAQQILDIKSEFGKGKTKEKILLEHTSVNPNASPHVGRARNSIIGDSIKKILEFSGHKVETHYYVNDVSKQIAMLALVFKSKDKFENLLERYVEISKKVKEDPELEKQVFELLHKFEHKDAQVTNLFRKIVDIAIQGQKEIFSKLGIDFDYFDYESKYLGEQKKILEELEKTGKLFKDEENRMVLNQKNTGLETKMKSPVLVLTRNDNTGLYVLRDLAYTIEKCKKARNIIVLGEDQKLYFEQLCHALRLLKKPCPEVVHYSFVLLKDVGKMSTRSGEVVLLEEFFEEAVKKAELEIKTRKAKGEQLCESKQKNKKNEQGWEENSKKIAIAAIKYAMLRNENNKNITFDWDTALSFEGDSGPYLQYSYARASSILKKAKKTGKIEIPKLSSEEFALIKKLLQFPEIREQAYKTLSPHIIANYSFELCQIFNEFYHVCKVVGSDEESFRLSLVQSFRIVLKSSLNLLGIEVMEEM